MPELPEVECLTRVVRVALKGGRLLDAAFLRADLREPIPVDEFRRLLVGEVVEDVFRRSKYLLMKTRRGYGVIHLGMTGALVQHDTAAPQEPHTHAVFRIANRRGRESYLHYVDARRFGRISCLAGASYESHAFFENLGPEPLVCPDLGGHLFNESRGRKQPIKAFLMDARMVVGVGNIYASESLFRAGIHPEREAGSVARARYGRLAAAVRETLEASIQAGGTTFRDFRNADGKPGYFAVSLNVYDRADEPCRRCAATIRQLRQSGRSTFFCPVCQS